MSTRVIICQTMSSLGNCGSLMGFASFPTLFHSFLSICLIDNLDLKIHCKTNSRKANFAVIFITLIQKIRTMYVQLHGLWMVELV